MSERDAVSRILVAPLASVSSGGIAVTSSGTHTKGSYTEVIPAADLPFDVHEVIISAYSIATTGTDTGYSVDFAIGAAASELIVIPDILVGHRPSGGLSVYRFPVFIPASTRIAMRGQSVQSADVAPIAVSLIGGSPWGNPAIAGAGFYTSYGFTAGTTRGVVPTGSGSANVKGSWAQITASTTRDHSVIVPSIQGNDGVLVDASCRFDIGVGGAGSELVIVPDLFCRTTSLEEVTGPVPSTVLLRKVPSGSRLAVRLQASTTTHNDLNVVLHCS